MELDPRTPVLVGVGVATQRGDDPAQGHDAVGLMAEALAAAADDAGSRALVAEAGQVAVPRGTWPQADPGRLVADRLGATGATTVVAEIGILQQDLLTEACAAIAAGRLDVAVVVGGEAKHRAGRARSLGVVAPESTEAEGARPDRVVAAGSLGVHDLEITRNVVTPATSYALIEHARAHAAGLDPVAHRAALGNLWAGFAQVAAANPHAWDRRGLGAEAITTAGPENRLVSTPYTKLLCSQWNVDQAAAVVLCSVGAARRHGVAPDRWVFPWSAASANHAVPVAQRVELGEVAGAPVAAARALALAGVGPAELGPVDLYSCFPSAVQALAASLGLPTDRPADRPLTVTGGMTFAGGPLNNYVLQALAALAGRLRAVPAAVGVSSSVSGFLVKQGFGLWSASPPAGGFRHEDVSAEVAARLEATGGVAPLEAEHAGPATVASWTVAPDPYGATRSVAVCDLPSGARTLATTDDPATAAAMAEGDWVGRVVELGPGGALHLT